MDYRKLDPELQEIALQCLHIHTKIETQGFRDMNARQFRRLKITNLNNYIAFATHEMFDSGLNDVVIIIPDLSPERQPEIEKLLDHNQGGLRFTKTYAEDIALYKRKVYVWVFFLDGSSISAMYGVKDIAAKKVS